MSNDICTREQFLNDIKDHKLKIIQDDGLYRHLRMTSGSSFYRYDIITWPGHLCITGDCGSYLFSRIEDMFNFFRDENQQINPRYWGEKVLSESVFGEGVEKFSVEKFTQNVIEWATEEIEDEDEKADMMEEIDELLNCEDEWECVEALRNFTSKKVDFTDFWEMRCEKYTPQYIWCLYGIVYAIKKYDETIHDQKAEVRG